MGTYPQLAFIPGGAIMNIERNGLIDFHGEDQTVVGADIEVGQQAPAFKAVANDWSHVDPINDYQGKVRVLSSILSLETSVCDTETKRFNEAAAALGDDVAIFVLSHDLPFTQERWCGTEGVERVMTLSDSALDNFGPKYGVRLKEMRVLRRAVFVVDRAGVVTYADYMPKLGVEPDYDAVLNAVRDTL
jgi:thiol peroxidase